MNRNVSRRFYAIQKRTNYLFFFTLVQKRTIFAMMMIQFEKFADRFENTLKMRTKRTKKGHQLGKIEKGF